MSSFTSPASAFEPAEREAPRSVHWGAEDRGDRSKHPAPGRIQPGLDVGAGLSPNTRARPQFVRPTFGSTHGGPKHAPSGGTDWGCTGVTSRERGEPIVV